MKKIILGLCLLVTGTFCAKSQGLDGFTVEKFYVTNAADNAGNGSTGTPLPTGSIVWRFYADLAPGYQLLNVYGNASQPLEISTTTSFFNNIDRGAIFGQGIGAGFIANNTVYIDSYLSLGATCSNRSGVLKVDDDATNNIAFGGGYLQNNNASAGQPLTARDGSSSTTTAVITPQTVGLGTAADIFALSPSAGNSFLINSVTGGGYFAPAGTGATGFSGNKVLIAQMTSDGVITYKFNLLIQEIATLTSISYVSINPVAGEVLVPSLAGQVNVANAAPTVSVTAPSNGATFLVGQSVPITANANDPDGTITNVEFLLDGSTVLGSDNTSPYALTPNWTAVVGAHVITARATDNLGGITTSTGINVTVGNIVAPTLSITSPTAGANFFLAASVPITATVVPGNSAVTQVEFFANGTSVGVATVSPYTVNWTANILGSVNLTAVATDANGATGNSSGVSISVFDPTSAYVIGSSSNPCSSNILCLPISAISAVDNVIGYDIVLSYDNTKVQPTGVVTVAPSLINPAFTSTANSIDNANGLMYISVFFNASAPPATEFNGTGELLCVQFARTAGFSANDTADFSVTSLQESYFNGVQPKVVSPGQFITFQETQFNSSLKFWSNNGPLGYDGTGTATLITNIYGNNNGCTGPLSATAVQPDINGNFNYDYANGPSISIQRDIVGTTSVQPVVNGFDAFLTRRVLINDATFLPSSYQMMAMDVNIDGVVSAGDLSQINQRAVLLIAEFKQAWNYDASGNPIAGAGPSKDWVFVDGTTLNSDPAYVISANYPFPDGLGFDKSNVPVKAFCLQVPYTVTPTCNVFSAETYTGILVGDVNGNFANVGSGGNFRNASDMLVVDLANAISHDGFIDVPVRALSSDAINAVDFSLNFNENKMSFGSTVNASADVETLSHFNTDDREVRFTSYSLNNYDANSPVVYIRFASQANSINAADLSNVQGYLNGEKVGVQVTGNGIANGGALVQVYPNPASTSFNIIVSDNSSMQLFDADGRMLMEKTDLNAFQKYEYNTEKLSKGIYLMKVYSNNMVTMKKVVIQ